MKNPSQKNWQPLSMSTLAVKTLLLARTPSVVLRPQYRHSSGCSTLSRVLLATTALSVLGSTRTMAAATSGQCANTNGPIPRSIEGTASDILKARRYLCWQAEHQCAVMYVDRRAVCPGRCTAPSQQRSREISSTSTTGESKSHGWHYMMGFQNIIFDLLL